MMKKNFLCVGFELCHFIYFNMLSRLKSHSQRSSSGAAYISDAKVTNAKRPPDTSK